MIATNSFRTIFGFIIIFNSNISSACWETQLEYEITRNCEVRIIFIHSELKSLEDEAHWLNYLQHSPGSYAEKKAGVPSTARKIFRPDDITSLYCEFNDKGLIDKAYTIPAIWDESQEQWINLDIQPVKVVDGLLPETEYHTSYVDTCE